MPIPGVPRADLERLIDVNDDGGLLPPCGPPGPSLPHQRPVAAGHDKDRESGRVRGHVVPEAQAIPALPGTREIAQT